MLYTVGTQIDLRVREAEAQPEPMSVLYFPGTKIMLGQALDEFKLMKITPKQFAFQPLLGA